MIFWLVKTFCFSSLNQFLGDVLIHQIEEIQKKKVVHLYRSTRNVSQHDSDRSCWSSSSSMEHSIRMVALTSAFVLGPLAHINVGRVCLRKTNALEVILRVRC